MSEILNNVDEVIQQTIDKYGEKNIKDISSDEYREELLRRKNKIISTNLYTTLSRTITTFDHSGDLENISPTVLEKYLQCEVVCAIIEDKNKKLVAVPGSLMGYPGTDGRQHKILVSRMVGEYVYLNGTYDEDKGECVIIHNDAYDVGVIPFIVDYSQLIGENILSLRCSLINSRAMFIMSSGDDSVVEAANKFLDNLELGKLSSLIDSMVTKLDTTPLANVSNITQLIESLQYLTATQLQTIGINSNFNMKRERINTAESSLNDDVLTPLLDNMLHEREKGWEKVKEVFNRDIAVKLHGIFNHEEIMEEEINETEGSMEENPDEPGNDDNAE